MKTPLLADVYAVEAFQTHGHQMVDLLAKHLKAAQKATRKTIPYTDPEIEKKFWEQYPEKQDFQTLAQDLIDRSIHVHQPKYIGHQVAPPAPITAVSSMLTSFLNNGSAVYEMGIANTAIERIITDQLCAQLGFDSNARGFLTSGGTLANLTALLAARSVKDRSGVWKNGHDESLGILVCEEAHYCVDRAARIMGLGDKGILKVPATTNYAMDTAALEETLEKAKQEGIQVFAIVGSAPSTATGTIDPLDKIASFAQKHGLWFHVDAAHGGAAIYSTTFKKDLAGIEKADSVAIDGHKMMMMPALTTALLFKDGSHSYQTFSQKADYLLSDADHEDWYNMAKRTFECTKSMMSIHWFVLLNQYGTSVFDEFVTKLYQMGRQFAEIIKKDANFELALEPQTNIVCFRMVQKQLSEKELNTLNERLRFALVQEGSFYIVQTKLRGTHYLRVTIMNPKTDPEILSALLTHLKELAKPILQNLK